VALVVAGIVWYSSRPGEYDTFASCIKDSGAKFFGAFWCPHCQEQKALFGKSASKLPYVECSKPSGNGQLPICDEAGVKSYPTWESPSGERKTGTLSFAELSAMTMCPAVKDSK
jgi:thiol-disulfide isomerase/thioredoxin